MVYRMLNVESFVGCVTKERERASVVLGQDSECVLLPSCGRMNAFDFIPRWNLA